MDRSFSDFKRQARALAAGFGTPQFERACAGPLAFARDLFFEHPLTRRLQEDMLPFLYDDFGHGIEHAKRVAVDAAAIVLAEAEVLHMEVAQARHLALLAELAGLLHDVCRMEPAHQRRGAELARMILADYALAPEDVETVALAVQHHEDMQQPALADPGRALVAAALHDADVFRWGPDFFVTTLWEVCDYEEWSNEEVLSRFGPAADHARSLAATLRTAIGRMYGPALLAVGLRLGPLVLEHFGHPQRRHAAAGCASTACCGSRP